MEGVGTEHLIIKFIDRVLKMLDSTRDKTAILAVSVDWTSAFDRIDHVTLSKKFINLGIRPSIIQILISYLSKKN